MKHFIPYIYLYIISFYIYICYVINVMYFMIIFIACFIPSSD